MLLRFCKDYRHIMINTRYELILIRLRNNNNLISDLTREPKIVKNIIQSTVTDASCVVERDK